MDGSAGRVVCVRFADKGIDQCLHWSKRLYRFASTQKATSERRRGESFVFASRTNVSTSVCTGRSGSLQESRDLVFRLSLFPASTKKHHPFGWCFLVEAGRVELPSENSLTGTSPGAVCSLHSLIRPGADTLPDSVASSMHGTGKAYRTHVLHSDDTRARLVDLSGRMGRPN